MFARTLREKGIIMFRSVKRKSPGTSALYVVSALILVVVALPHLRQHPFGLQGVFQFGWLGFALLVIAANLWFALSVPSRSPVTGSRHPRSGIQYTPRRLHERQGGRTRRR